VPPTDAALTLGTSLGDIISESEKKIVCIGSTDLTHYGPRYGFTPMGAGIEGLKWASDVNDRKFIDLALKMAPDGMLVEAAENGNACGPGAAAATVAAAKKLGRTRGLLLAYTNSNEVMQREMGASSTDSVGYAAIVF
jgi:AmmeMemoRadiSam system protein B